MIINIPFLFSTQILSLSLLHSLTASLLPFSHSLSFQKYKSTYKTFEKPISLHFLQILLLSLLCLKSTISLLLFSLLLFFLFSVFSYPFLFLFFLFLFLSFFFCFCYSNFPCFSFYCFLYSSRYLVIFTLLFFQSISEL